MAAKKRWIISVTEEAAKLEVKMPWARGARREDFIRKRAAANEPQKARAAR